MDRDSGVVPNQNPHSSHNNSSNSNSNFHHISAKVLINRSGATESSVAEDERITVNGFYVNGGGGGVGSSSNNTDSDVHSSSATSMTNEDSLSDSGILMECERGQVESFFSGLGTEVSAINGQMDRELIVGLTWPRNVCTLELCCT